MISVLLLGFDSSGRQAAAAGDAVRTLASLVSAAVEGVVRDLCLAGPEGDRVLADVADHAGCIYLGSPSLSEALPRAARRLRCPQILVARCGMVAERPFIEELSTLLPTLDGASHSFVLKAARPDLLGRLFPSTGATAAVLVQRAWLQAVEASSLEELSRRAKPGHLFKTRVWISP